jgi:hypothetical protein
MCLVCVQELVGSATQVSTYVDVVFSEALHDYPGMELTWLQRLYTQRSIQVPPEVDINLCVRERQKKRGTHLHTHIQTK